MDTLNFGLGFLNGGIISTVLDCHSAAAGMWEADRYRWPALAGAALPYVTAGAMCGSCDRVHSGTLST